MNDRVYLLGYKGKGDFLDLFRRYTTLSRYSHIEIGKIHQKESNIWKIWGSSFRDNGIREKLIEFKPENWDLIPLNIDFKEFLEFYEKYRNTKYDYQGFLTKRGINLKYLKKDVRKMGNAEFVAKFLGLQNSETITAGDLFLEYALNSLNSLQN